jgi:putative alpha-1,2-mannosidase
MYIQSATLRDEPLDNCWFYHSDFIKGGTLKIELGKAPNYDWGISQPPPSRDQSILKP